MNAVPLLGVVHNWCINQKIRQPSQPKLVGKIAFPHQVQLDLARLDEGGMTQNGYRQCDNSGENCGRCENDNCHDDGDGDGDGDDDDDTLFNKQAKMMSL